jgi:hypothetical protein
MVRGFYSAAAGVLSRQKSLNVISNNIANGSTAGYKSQSTIESSFGHHLVARMNTPQGKNSNNVGPGTFMTVNIDEYTNFSQGSLEQTGRPFDMAINGQGFFLIESENYGEVTILPMDKFNEKENRNSITISEKLKTKKIINKDALLLTHTGFSGPAILNLSRYISIGQQISINYYNHKPFHILKKELSAYLKGNSKQLITALYEYFNQDLSQASSRLPKRFLEIICLRSDMDPTQKASQLSGKALHSVVSLITQDTYSVSGLGGFNVAMVTKGGVDLDEINIKTMECKKYPGLFFAGEVLDVDGDTGGYNLQFAFSSGYTAANGSRIISSKNHEKNSSIEKNSKHN